MVEGIKIFYQNHLFPPVHYLQILIPKGTFFEPIEKKGVDEALISNLFLFSEKYKNKELRPLFDVLGSSTEIALSEEFTLISLTSFEENFEKAIKLFFDSLFFPEFEEKKLESSKKTLIGGLKIMLTDPQFISECHLFELSFGEKHPLGKNQNIKMLKSINLNDIKKEYDALIETKNWAIFISSPWDKEKIQDILFELFKNYGSKNKNSYDLNKVPSIDKPKVRIVPKKGMTQVVINALILSEPRKSDFYFPLKLSFYIFAEGGFSSRILRKIRVDMGSTYGVTGAYDVFKNIGYFQIGGMVKNEDFSKTVEMLKNLYKEWRVEGINKDELQEAKSFYLKTFSTLKDDPLDWGSFLLKNHLHGFPENYDEILINKIKDLSLEDIMNAHKKLPEEIPFWCFLGDEKIIKPAASASGEFEVKNYFDLK